MKGDDVVVTGLGVVSPIGATVPRFWRAALDGVVGTAPLTGLTIPGLPPVYGGRVPDLPHHEKPAPCTPDLSRAAQLAIAAAEMCLNDAGIVAADCRAARIGLAFGTVGGSRPLVEDFVGRWAMSAPSRRGYACSGDVSAAVARVLGTRGPTLTIPTACAAGNTALSYAAEAIRSGRAEAMIAGGADQLSQTIIALFAQLHALAPERVCPFDRDRAGILISEGAAALFLEPYDRASRRGASIYCKISGYASVTEVYHMTAPDPSGAGAARAMREALAMADLDPAAVGFISAHGTGTPANDAAEAKAIRDVFHSHGSSAPPVSALKSLIGHTQGAAAAIEAVACALTIRDRLIHPTSNTDNVDPELGIDLVTSKPRSLDRAVVLSNAFGFGGNICCAVLQAVD